MGRRTLFSLVLLLCAEATFAQVATTSSTSTSTTIDTSRPVAWLYVSSKHYIHAYKVWANGSLTSITGSPFPYVGIGSMSVTKQFLFGDEGSNVDTFAIASNGSLSKISSINAMSYESNGCLQGGAGNLVDFSQITLYRRVCSYGYDTNQYLSFHIQSSGSLQFLGGSGGAVSAATQGNGTSLTKMGGNPFAFDSYCAEDEYNRPVIQIFKRQSNGNLIFEREENHMPEPAPGTSYCAGMVAADTSNHLAAAVQRIDAQPHDAGYIDGPYFLASYTADSNGNLTTTSNYTNMPRLAVAENLDVRAISISPDNQYVAVAADGFQVLHFNGGNPPTNFSGAFLTGQYVGSFGWDRAHHLYVIALKYSNGTYTSFLHVYNVTSTGVKEVSGSPHYLANLSGLTVLSLQ
jgi:hypothetical protein